MFRYRIAERGSDDLALWRKVRTDLYLEAGLILVDDLDEHTGLYFDVFDEHSVHLLATDDAGVIIGCCRMIDGNSTRLQVAQQFGLAVPAGSFEVSGTAVYAPFRKTFATLGFYRALFALANEREYEYAYMEVEEPFLAALEALGLPIEVVSETRYVYNSYNLVVLIRMSHVVQSLMEADAVRGGTTTFGRYFGKPFTWSLDDTDILANARERLVDDV